MFSDFIKHYNIIRKDFNATNIHEIIDSTNTSILPNPENAEHFEENFKAMVEEKAVKYSNVDSYRNEFGNKHALPIRLEYSLRNGRFRVSMYSLIENKPIMANIYDFQGNH